MIWWTGLAPWEFEFPFPGSRISAFLWCLRLVVGNAIRHTTRGWKGDYIECGVIVFVPGTGGRGHVTRGYPRVT
jgi:hypothetical protein